MDLHDLHTWCTLRGLSDRWLGHFTGTDWRGPRHCERPTDDNSFKDHRDVFKNNNAITPQNDRKLLHHYLSFGSYQIPYILGVAILLWFQEPVISAHLAAAVETTFHVVFFVEFVCRITPLGHFVCKENAGFHGNFLACIKMTKSLHILCFFWRFSWE
jgi:hypothetical protein